MISKEFNKRFDEIAISQGMGRLDIERFSIDTAFGTLTVRADPTPKIKLYSIYMRFKDYRKENYLVLNGKEKYFSNTPSSSGKWNIHNSDEEYVLNLFEERLSNILYLSK